MMIEAGKEYIFVPRPNDGSLDLLHGATFVPLTDAVWGIVIGKMQGKQYMAYVDELLPPGVTDEA